MCKGQRALWTAYGMILVLAVLTSAVLAGCSGASNGIQLGADDNGTRVKMKKGQTLVVSLESNPTTGYSWQMVPSDDGVLVQVGEAKFEESPRGRDMVGVGGVETLRFQAKETGQTTLELAYRRPWETSEKPIETFSIQVTVE